MGRPRMDISDEERRARKLSATRRWRKQNREKARRHTRAWKKRNSEAAREYRRKWSKKNPDKIRAYRKKWLRQQEADPLNRERRLQKARLKYAELRENNLELLRSRWRKYDAIRRERDDPEKTRARDRAKYARRRNRDLEKLREKEHRKRARRRERQRAILALKEANNPKATLLGNSLYAAADAAVSKTLLSHVRDDVVSSIVLAVLEKRLSRSQIKKKAADFVRAYFKENNNFRDVSLDSAIRGTDSLTIGDMLDSNVIHF